MRRKRQEPPSSTGAENLLTNLTVAIVLCALAIGILSLSLPAMEQQMQHSAEMAQKVPLETRQLVTE